MLVSLALANLIQYLLNPKSSWWDFYIKAKLTEVLATIAGGIVMYAILFWIIALLSAWANRKWLFRNNVLAHFILTTVVVIICMFLLLSLENLVYEWIWPEPSENSKEIEQGVRNYLVVNLVAVSYTHLDGYKRQSWNWTNTKC